MLILVDAGGVLFNNVTESTPFLQRVAERCGVDARLLRELYEGGDRDFETDRRDVKNVLLGALRALGAGAEEESFTWVERLYEQSVASDPEVFDIIRELQGNGLETALSNNEARRWDEIKNRRYAHFGLFTHIASSWRVREVKPEKTFFAAVRAVCKAEGPLLLIDDNPEVVDAALRQGLQVVQFTDAQRLRTELRDRGLLPGGGRT